MSIPVRFKASSRVALVHFCISFAVVIGIACFVLFAWFPGQLYQLTGGAGLFAVLLFVDLVCGPGLTLILFDPKKTKWKWRLDIVLIAVVQILALGFGVFQIAKTRPVYFAFEGDRFRLVQALDIDVKRIKEAPIELQSLPWNGPRPLGVRLALPTDHDFLVSVQESIQGFHPAFRPSRWLAYDSQADLVLSSAKSLGELESKSTTPKDILTQAVAATGLPKDRLGYLPLVRDLNTSWIVLVNLQSAQPVGWLPIDGW